MFNFIFLMLFCFNFMRQRPQTFVQCPKTQLCSIAKIDQSKAAVSNSDNQQTDLVLLKAQRDVKTRHDPSTNNLLRVQPIDLPVKQHATIKNHVAPLAPKQIPKINPCIQGFNQVNEDMLIESQSKYEQLPVVVRSVFEENGVSIQICGTSLSNYLGKPYSILGSTVYQRPAIIYLQGNQRALDLAFFHECGHAYDNCLNFPSNAQEWYDIYQEERLAFQEINLDETGDYHDVASASEYFAAVFSNIIKNNPKLQTQCPKSYQFIKSYL